MFILHSSNKTENLFAHLAIVLDSAPLSSPLAEELFLIQSQGMERWLAQQLATRFKVFANYKFLFPVNFFNQIAKEILLDVSAYDRQSLVWRLEALLRTLDQDGFKPLQDFLAGENLELKRYQLAQEITRVFDQYQLLRLDLLSAWQQGQLLYDSHDEVWQAQLWQLLISQTDFPHRGLVWQQVIQQLRAAKTDEYSQVLPERISVFGINSMPPLFLEYLQALSIHTDVHLYLLNPVQHYWADLPSKRLQSQLTEFVGHPLLIKLGQQGREFQQLLLEQLEFQFEPSSFEDALSASNLHQLQNDILANQLTAIKLAQDDTISIHACHSRLREVQVLKNHILATLDANSDLQLRDIVVMAPDIQLYAPFINAVFADIAHTIADRSLKISNDAIQVFLSFLELSQSRFAWLAVLDLLEQPLVASHFQLNQDDLELIRYWLTDCQVRWGKSANHKLALGLPGTAQNTWQASLERLFMGYAINNDQQLVDGILPYSQIEGGSAQALGALNDYLQLLFQASEQLATAKCLSEWQTMLFNFADRLLGDHYTPERQALNELLDDLSLCANVHQHTLTLPVIIAWFNASMADIKSGNGFLRGQLTFCSMLPMRTIPFQVIALMGLNDGEFPRMDRSPRFDLVSQHPRLGDRSRRADDRYQFLEVLLSARKQLILTFIGLSQYDQREIPPSVIVSELLEVLADYYQLEHLVVYHPLHAFSKRYFNASQQQLFSYSASDCNIATGFISTVVPVQSWWQGSIDTEQPEVIDIDELFKFFQHPQRYFLQRQLGVYLGGIASEIDEREPFTLDNLSAYHIQQQCLAEFIEGKSPSLEKLQALGVWPAASLGEIVWQKQQAELLDFVDSIHSLQLGASLPAQLIDLSLNGYRLVGKLGFQYQHGCLIYRYAKLKGKDFMQAWLQHLLVNCLYPQTTHLLSKDKILLFTPQQADQQILTALLAVFLLGRQRPNAFFTEAAFLYLQEKHRESAINIVINKVIDQVAKGYEPEIAKLFTLDDLALCFDDGFVNICNTLLLPGWSH